MRWRRPPLVRLTCVLVFVVGSCTRPAPEVSSGRLAPGDVIIGAFDFTESRVLAHVYEEVLERLGHRVYVLEDVASRELMEPALEQGHVDLVVEYQGAALSFLLGGADAPRASPERTHDLLEARFAERGIAVLGYSPAENRNEIVVTASTAREHDLTDISDLRSVAPRLVFGGPPECSERPLCLQGLEDVYGLSFEKFQPLDVGGPLTVEALRGNEIDVGLLFTTDPAIEENGFVVLRDDRDLQPAENLVVVARTEKIDDLESAAIEEIDAVTARLTTPVLRGLNGRASEEGASPRAVARYWLRKENLL